MFEHALVAIKDSLRHLLCFRKSA